MWHVYSADRHLVATYSTKEAADSHIAAWPAQYAVEFVPPQPPVVDDGEPGPTSPLARSTRTKSHG